MRFSSLFSKRRSERGLEDELRFHLEAEAQKNVSSGMSEEEARRQARLALGVMEAAKEECREMRLGYWLETTMQDLGYGLRLLRKPPGFTAAGVAILALGVRATPAIFSTADAALR